MNKRDNLLTAALHAEPLGGRRPGSSSDAKDGGRAAMAPAIVSACAAFLRPKAVTAHYGIHRSSLYRALAEGKIVAVKAGRSILIDGASLRAYLASLPRAVFKAP